MSVWTSIFKHPIDYMLMEDNFYLLLESGSKIVLEQTGRDTSLWIPRTPKN